MLFTWHNIFLILIRYNKIQYIWNMQWSINAISSIYYFVYCDSLDSPIFVILKTGRHYNTQLYFYRTNFFVSNYSLVPVL